MECPQCDIECKVVREGDEIKFVCRNPQCESHGKVVGHK